MGMNASEPKISIPDLDDRRVVIWWHSAIKKNHRDRTQPNVVVSLRVLNDDGSFGPIEKRQLPITCLGFLRVGAIWANRRMVGCIDMDTCYLSGNISDKDIKVACQGAGPTSARQYMIPHHIYNLEDDYFHNHSWLLRMPMETSEGEPVQLIVPCMEVFNRLYGRNAEVRRILTTYPWSEASKRLFVPDSVFEDGNAWGIELPNRMTNDDTFLLAYLLHDEYAQKQGKSVYSQIEVSQELRGEGKSFLKIKPWFLGRLDFKLKGFWIDSKRFLGLQINGANIEPDSRSIIRSRNYGVPVRGGASGDGGPGSVPKKIVSNNPEKVEVTGESAPDQNSGYIDVAEEDFEVLGNRGHVIIDNHGTPYQEHSHASDDDDSKKFSGGEPCGKDKDVGKANIKSDITIESEGMVLDFWKALVMLSKSESNTINKVEYYSNRVFVEGDVPTLAAFRNFFSSNTFLTKAVPWGYVNAHKKLYRGALIVRAHTEQGYVYFIEIQRRKIVSRPKEGDEGPKDSPEVKEEMYRGVVFRLNKDDERSVLCAIIKVMQNLGKNHGTLTLSAKAFDGEIRTYVHRMKSVKDDNSEKKLIRADMCKRVVLNALGKVT